MRPIEVVLFFEKHPKIQTLQTTFQAVQCKIQAGGLNLKDADLNDVKISFATNLGYIREKEQSTSAKRSVTTGATLDHIRMPRHCT